MGSSWRTPGPASSLVGGAKIALARMVGRAHIHCMLTTIVRCTKVGPMEWRIEIPGQTARTYWVYALFVDGKAHTESFVVSIPVAVSVPA